jgi:NTP pyrophosphatase (non-canonical NTP hydrolase)
VSERDDLTEQAFHNPLPVDKEETDVDFRGKHLLKTSEPTTEYTVELGGQTFTAAQWDAIQTYARGTTAATLQDALPDTEKTIAAVNYAEIGLDHMLDMQREVESAWNRNVDTENPEAVSAYIRDVVLCATDELHEVLGEVNWKPWKNSRGIKNLEKYREEMADVLHFVLDLYLAAGLTGREIIVDYLTKHYENLRRVQSTEYRNN